MKAKMFVMAAAFAFGSGTLASAATIPAGTVFVVRTLHSISSTDAPGTRCPAELAHNLTAGGKVVLPAGTKFAGNVVTSRRLVSHPQKLTVDMTALQLGGRNLPISTTGAQFVSSSLRTPDNVSVSRPSYIVASGRLLKFHLAHPVNL